MELYQEFLLTAILSIVLFLLLGKLAASEEHDSGVTGGAGETAAKSSPEEKNYDASPSNLRNSENDPDLAAGVPDDRITPTETLSHEDLSKLERRIAGKVDLKKGKEEEEEEEEDWEGIERSELEKLFAVATAFADSERGTQELSKLSGDVQMQFYALHKVATEGPCYQPQPMALKLSARTKWNAWQRLGNMSPDVAMEQYVSLLSESIPGWTREDPLFFVYKDDTKLDKGNDTALMTESSSDLKSSPGKLDLDISRTSEDSSPMKRDVEASGSAYRVQGVAGSFLLNILPPTMLAFVSLLR